MASPVTPDQLKALLPNPTGNKCDAFLKALIAFPTKVYQLVAWLLDSSGNISGDFLRTVIPAGDLIFSAAPLSEGASRLLCNGQAVSRTTYATLYNVIGDIYGSGDGSTTFNVPDYRARFPVGVGRGTVQTVSGGVTTTTEIGDYDLGDEGGEKEHTLSEGEMPAHTHTHTAFRLATGSFHMSGEGTDSTNVNGYTGINGSGLAHENRPPYLACYIYIKT